MKIERLDHLVLTVKDPDATCAFYKRVLGMEIVTFGPDRKALTFGDQKINLHREGNEIEPKAYRPMPGSADFCFITSDQVRQVMDHLVSCGIHIIDGPVSRTGATGPIVSVYFRDPDMNLIEVSSYTPTESGK